MKSKGAIKVPRKKKSVFRPKHWKDSSDPEKLANLRCLETWIDWSNRELLSVNERELRWLTTLLACIAGGRDIRPWFFDRPSRGRNRRHLDFSIWSIAEKLTSEGLRGKKLWAALGVKFQIADGSARNAIAREKKRQSLTSQKDLDDVDDAYQAWLKARNKNLTSEPRPFTG